MILLACILPEFLTPERQSLLERYSDGRTVVATTERDEIEKCVGEAEIIIGRCPPDLLHRAPGLAWYQQLGTGVDWLGQYPETIEQPFTLTNCSDNHCVVIAEHVFALILTFSRAMPRVLRAQLTHEWDREIDWAPGMFEIRGKTLLIVGLGSIGQEVAKRGAAFGLRMIGIRNDPSKLVEGVERVDGMDKFAASLGEADIVVSTLPLTPETRYTFGAEAFDAMKTSAFFFNVGRGGTVDETAIAEALSAKKIAGAGLDVFETEPLPADSPLWDLPNAVLTPHTAGCHDRLYDWWLEVAFDNLKRYSEDQPLRNVVDKQRQY